MDYKRKISNKAWYALLMLLMFVGYIGCTTLFPHNHLINGRAVTHSHPYAGSPESPTHSHAQAQFTMIAMLSTFVATVANTTVALGALFTLSAIILHATKQHTAKSADTSLSLRDPPAVQF